MKLSAVIFDLDGTILEDEDEYGRAFSKVLKSLGVETNISTPQTKGIGVKENWELFIKKYGIKTSKSIEVLAKETQDAYLAEISEITVRPNFDELMEDLEDSGVKVALATSNSWEVTEDVLNKVDLLGIFDVITTIEEVTYSKPDPSLFTLTADKLGIERTECLVIEDSASGVEAAKRAEMKVIAISSTEKDMEDLSNADIVVEGFSEISPKLIAQL